MELHPLVASAAAADSTSPHRLRCQRRRISPLPPPPLATPHLLVASATDNDTTSPYRLLLLQHLPLRAFTVTSESHPSNATVACIESPSSKASASTTTSRLMQKATSRERGWRGREGEGGAGEDGGGEGAVKASCHVCSISLERDWWEEIR